MASVKPTITRLGDNAVRLDFALTAADSDGFPIGKHWIDYADRTVQITGSLNGGSVAIQGSNDGNNWFTLDDPQGVDLTFSALGGKAIAEIPAFVRPLLSGGAAPVVTASFTMRRARSGMQR